MTNFFDKKLKVIFILLICLLNINKNLRIYKNFQFLLSSMNFILSFIIFILKSNNRIRKEIIKHKYLYEDIEEIGIFIYINLMCINNNFFSILLLFFFIDCNITNLKCSIPIHLMNLSKKNRMNITKLKIDSKRKKKDY